MKNLLYAKMAISNEEYVHKEDFTMTILVYYTHLNYCIIVLL